MESTLKLWFEAADKSIFDQLDIFSDAADVKNTQVVFFRSLFCVEKSSAARKKVRYFKVRLANEVVDFSEVGYLSAGRLGPACVY